METFRLLFVHNTRGAFVVVTTRIGYVSRLPEPLSGAKHVRAGCRE
jgi:hypothetical protein